MSIRFEKFNASDHLEEILVWWAYRGETGPTLEMIPETSYIMFSDNKPILFISLIMTNTEVCWLENLIGNPQQKGPNRKECGALFLSYIDNVAKANGKKRFFCMSTNEKTTQRYIELGFHKTLDNVSTFVRSI